MPKVFISSDHRGYQLRRHLVQHWGEILGADAADFPLVDLGPDEYDPEDDFNDAAVAVARAVLREGGAGKRSPAPEVRLAAAGGAESANFVSADASAPADRLEVAEPPAFGLLLCGSAHGICIQANRFRGIRAVCGYDPDLARLGREHNDANVLCLSADRTATPDAAEIIRTFLSTAFLAEPRFIRRNQRLDAHAHDLFASGDASASISVTVGINKPTSAATDPNKPTPVATKINKSAKVITNDASHTPPEAP